MGIWGDRDMAMRERQMTDSAAHDAGRWRYERVGRAGHWIPTQAPELISELLLDFFGT